MAMGHVIIIKPDSSITVEDVLDNGEPQLGQLQKAVDGYVEVAQGFDTVSLSNWLLVRMDEASVRKLMPVVPEAQRCIAFCNEDGKVHSLPYNETASQLWAVALVNNRTLKKDADGKVWMRDVLVGSIALLIGEAAIKGWRS